MLNFSIIINKTAKSVRHDGYKLKQTQSLYLGVYSPEADKLWPIGQINPAA